MSNNKKFVVKNGLQTQNIDFVSNNESNTVSISVGDDGLISVNGNISLSSITFPDNTTLNSASALAGTSGFSGATGSSGFSGDSGISGFSGQTGDSGISGFSGQTGDSGFSGFSGYSGFSGATGTGTSGFSGDSGFSGFSGQTGDSGFSGFSGQTGDSGFSGYSGAIGETGISGFSGFSGDLGTSGFSGQTGDSGISGYSGTSGYSGDNPGSSGFSGFSGYSGISGLSGSDGLVISETPPENTNILWVDTTVFGSIGFNLTISEIDNDNAISNSVENVNTLRFDSDTGFNVEDLGSGEVKISLGSTFKTWKVNGQSDLVAVGEDTVEFVAGSGIKITTDSTSNVKSITFESTSIDTDVDNVKITGGTVDQVLKTDGFGNLSWVDQSGGDFIVTTTSINKTIVNKERCLVVENNLSITLPLSPIVGSEVGISVLDFDNTTLLRNGEKIMGLSEDFIINLPNITVSLFYVDTTYGWRIL
jgi:hypothetical protein